MSLNEGNLEKRFNMVSTSAGSIQSLSSLCLHYKNHHKKIAQIWLRCLQKAKVPQRLILIYLANDIVQNAKRKNSVSFIEDFKTILKDTIPYLRDEKIRQQVERVFSIWQDRSVYDSKFITELKNALNNTGRSSGNESSLSASGAKNSAQAQQRQYSNDLMECLNRISNIEKNVDNLKSSSDNVIDKLARGPLSNGDLGNAKVMEEMKFYLNELKSEIEERNKLAKLLEESMLEQKKLLKESEHQLEMYKSQFEQIVKLRDELG